MEAICFNISQFYFLFLEIVKLRVFPSQFNFLSGLISQRKFCQALTEVEMMKADEIVWPNIFKSFFSFHKNWKTWLDTSHVFHPTLKMPFRLWNANFVPGLLFLCCFPFTHVSMWHVSSQLEILVSSDCTDWTGGTNIRNIFSFVYRMSTIADKNPYWHVMMTVFVLVRVEHALVSTCNIEKLVLAVGLNCIFGVQLSFLSTSASTLCLIVVL